jgi:hypothetical protein
VRSQTVAQSSTDQRPATYPAERDAILQAFGDAGGRDRPVPGRAGPPRRARGPVEFITTSLTSQNVDDKMRCEPRTGSVLMESARGWMPSGT